MKIFRSLLPALVLSMLAAPALAAIRPCATPITLSPGTLTGGTTGLAYSQTLTASGGTAFTFSSTKGGLPPGFALTSPTATTTDLTGSPTTPGTFVFTLTARNTPDGCSGGRTFALFVNARTLVTTTGGTTAFVEDAGAVVVDSGVTVTDTDSPNLSSAAVTITNPQDGAAEVLAAPACAGLTVTPGLNSLSITGSQPPATYQACLRSVTYNNASQNPGMTARVLSFVANDGIASSATANKTVSVAAVNDPPVANAISPPAFNEDTASSVTLSYTDAEGDLATACAVTGPTNVTVSTPCSCTAGVCTVGVTGTSNYNGPASFSYTVTANAQTSNSATASLTITAVADPPVANPISPPAFNEDVAAVITLSYTDPDGDQATACAVTAPTNVTVSTACACSAGACTVGVTGTPLNYNGAASFSYTVTAGAQTSNSALASLTVTAVNDPPVLGGVSGGFTYTENDAATAIAPTLTVTDVDSTTMSSATVTISANFQSGQDVLSFVNGGGMGNIAGSTAGAVLTLTSAGSTATTAQWETALRVVRYNNSSDDPNTSVRTVTFQINDGGAANNLSNQVSRTITVTAVNDAPTANAFAAQPAQAGIPIAYPAGKLGGTDLEAGTTLTIDLTPINVTNGTVSLNANGSFTFTPLPAATTGSFQYRVTDNGNPAPGVNSAYVTVSLTVAGPAIYFVKSAAVGLGNCTLGNECTLATALTNLGASTNARIFISDGNSHGSAVPINSGGWLIGQGVTGTTFDALFGIGAPAQGTLAPRPGLAGARPTVTNTVTLNTNGSVRGLNISSATATGMNDPVGAITGVTVSEVAVTTTTGTGVNFSSTGGTLSFTGLATNGGTGASLATNTGGTFAFTGVSVSSGTNPAFVATGGGTVTVTGAANTLASTTGTALNVANTTIGASGLTFRSISANGSANGIVLDQTGSGALTVTGDGNATTGGNGSGGTIQNATNYGVSLNNCQNVSLTNMTIQNTSRNGIDGSGVANFTFTNGTISNAGTASAGQYEENLIGFNDGGTFAVGTVTGVVTITGNVFSQPRRNGIDLETGNGTISDIVVSNNTFTGGTTTGSILHAILVLAQGTAATTSSITTGKFQNNTISGFRFLSGAIFIGGSGIFVAGGNPSSAGATTLGTAANPIEISGNDVDNVGSNGIQVSFNGINGIGNFNIHNNGTQANPMSNMEGLGISVFFGGSGTFSALVNNNAIDNNGPTVHAGSSGIAVQLDDAPTGAGTATGVAAITVNNNIITNPDGFGLRGIVRASNGTLNLKMQNNDVGTPFLANRNAIRVDGGSAAGNTTLCLSMTGNTGPLVATNDSLVGSGVNAGIGLRKQGTVAGVNFFGLNAITANPTNAQVQAHVGGLNTTANGSGGSVNGVDIISGSAYMTCSLP